MAGPRSRWNQVTGTATGVARTVVKSTKALTSGTPHDALEDVREVLRKADARLSRIFEKARPPAELASTEGADASHVPDAPRPDGIPPGKSGSRS